MRKSTLLFSLICLIQISLIAQEDIVIGKYINIESKILGGDVKYLVHLPYGYDNSEKEYPVIFVMNGHLMTTFANSAATIDKLLWFRADISSKRRY